MKRRAKEHLRDAADDWSWREEAVRHDALTQGLSDAEITERVAFFRDVWNWTQERSAAEGPLYTDILAILTRHDPVGIAFAENPDEYEPETRAIMVRVSQANGVGDLRKIIHEEFFRLFGTDYFRGDELETIACEIWEAVRCHGGA